MNGCDQEPPLGDRDLPTSEEVATETDHFLERDVIRYHAVSDAAYGSKETLFRVDSPLRQAAAVHFSRYYHRELQFDMPPYTQGDESEDLHVVLLRSHRLGTCVPIAAGAAGMLRVGDTWLLTWIWIHHWERGDRHHTTQRVFDALDAAYGQFKVEAPVSGAMRGLLKKRGYENRVVTRGKG
jgi:hypothetical protein